MCILKHVEEVEDWSSTPMGCNAMYVGDVEDKKHVLAHNFLNIQQIFNSEKVLESWDTGLFNHIIKYCVY